MTNQVWFVELRAAGGFPDGELQRLQKRLASCEAEVVFGEDGVAVRFRIQARRLAEAVTATLNQLEGQLPIVRLSVMTLEELQRQPERERNQLSDLVGIVDIQELAGLRSKQRALQVTKLPAFPARSSRAGRAGCGHRQPWWTSSTAGRADPDGPERSRT